MKLALVGFITSRIERKLALLLSLVALISLFLFGWLSIRSITVTRERNIAELEWQLANQTVDRLRKYLVAKVETFRIVIADPKVTAIGHDQQKFVLEGLLQADSALEEASFMRPDGHELWRVLRQVQATPPNLRVFNASSDVVATAAAGKNYLSPVFFEQGKPRLVLAAPVINYQGKVIGILRGEVDLNSLAPLVAQANLGQAGYLYLLDQDNNLLAASSNLANFNARLGQPLNYGFIAAVRQGQTELGASQAEYLISPLTSGRVFAVGRLLLPFNWLVAVEWPEPEAMQILPQIIMRLVAAALLLLGLLVLFSLIIARRFAKPIQQLGAAAHSIGQGKFAVTLPTAAQDEVGRLARHFAEMIKGLQELERLKDEFVFIAAHELRTPVTAIRGYAEMLTDLAVQLPPPAKEFVNRLQQSGARLANLVNDLLEVARDQAGRLQCQTSPQDALAIIKTVVTELAPLVKEKQHNLIFQAPANLPLVLADKDKLQEVLVNLVSNAIKYTPPAGTITISTAVCGDEVHLSVKDNGIGIAPADQASLFQRFFRVESDETKGVSGTGLGLFIVRQLVERMGGKIWLESEKGKGSTFTFYLKLAPVAL